MNTSTEPTSNEAECGNKSKPLLGDVLLRLKNAELHFRIENDEELIYFSIIDRMVYPRIWADNFRDNENKIISETTDNLLERTMIGCKDWVERFQGENIEECLYFVYEWMSSKNIS